MAASYEEQEEKKESVTLSETSTEEKTDDANGNVPVEKESVVEEYQRLLKAKEALLSEKEKIRQEIVQLREQRRSERSNSTQTQQPVEEEKPVQKNGDPDLQTTEGWQKFIEQKSKEAVTPVLGELEKIRLTHKNKAMKEFTKRHSEYSSANDANDEKLKALFNAYDRVKSRSENDYDDILEDLEDAWAVQNRSVIFKKHEELKKARLDNEYDLASVASTMGGTGDHTSSNDGEATPIEQRAARIAGVPLKRYLELKSKHPDFFDNGA